MPFIEVLNGPEVGNKTPLTHDTFFIGRDPNNHLVLSDRTVSRKHSVINHVEGKYVINDLKSLKGLLINGVKKEEATLEHGDEIAIGAVRLRFHADGKAEAIPLPFKTKPVKSKIWLFISVLVAVLVGGLYFWKGSDFFATRDLDLPAIQLHYERGVFLFNAAKDKEGAKREWEKVLELDPDKQTPYAQKALKLLENL